MNCMCICMGQARQVEWMEAPTMGGFACYFRLSASVVTTKHPVPTCSFTTPPWSSLRLTEMCLVQQTLQKLVVCFIAFRVFYVCACEENVLMSNCHVTGYHPVTVFKIVSRQKYTKTWDFLDDHVKICHCTEDWCKHIFLLTCTLVSCDLAWSKHAWRTFYKFLSL